MTVTHVGKAKGLVLTAVLLLGCGGAGPAGKGSSPATHPIDPRKSLMITTPEVVADPERTVDPGCAVPADEAKVWTIGHMLGREADKLGLDHESYARVWMDYWTAAQSVHDQVVPRLDGPAEMSAWELFGGPALGMYGAPFYLLAIVNRLDLRAHRPFGQPLGGEIRFVFGMVEVPQGSASRCPSSTFDLSSTLILEYSPAKASENEVRELAERWASLSDLSGDEYRSTLESLTEEVVNDGRLLRVRTNEHTNDAEDSGWHLTEFEPASSSRYLARTTTKQSPTMTLFDGTSTLLAEYIVANERDLASNALDASSDDTSDPIGDYVVPEVFPGTETYFLGVMNEMGTTPDDDFWNAPEPSGGGPEWAEARFRFSLGTCDGCHGRETNTSFLHVKPEPIGTEAILSDFLKGPIVVEDPVYPSRTRELDEMKRRVDDLSRLAAGAPVSVPVFGDNYTVEFVSGRLCLDSSGGDSFDGSYSRAATCNGNPNQRLSFVEVSLGVYRLKYEHSGKCIDVEDGSTSDGARVVQNTCDGARPSQELSLEVAVSPQHPSPRLLRFHHSNLCLTVKDLSTADGAEVVQGPCTNEQAYAFNLVE